MAWHGVTVRFVRKPLAALFSLIFTLSVVNFLNSSSYQELISTDGGGGGPLDRMAPARYRACDRDLAARYHTLVPRQVDQEANLFRRRAWRLLSVAVSACERLRIPHWLGSGTLLGFVRQCELVPAMGDVDLELASEAFTEEGGATVAQFIEAVTSAGLQQTTKFGMLNDSMEMAFEDNFGTRIDVFFSYPDGESRYTAGVDADTLNRIRWVYPRIELCWSSLDGLVIGVPCDPRRYLETSYGPNWTLPLNKEWNYRTDAANTVQNGYWPEEVRHEVVQLLV